MTNDSSDQASQHETGDRVTIQIPAYIVETYPNGDVRVDADGSELLVDGDEIQ